MFQLGKLAGDVGKHEKFGIFDFAGELVNTLVGKLDRTVFLVNDEVKGIGDGGHLTAIVLKVVGLGLEQEGLHSFLAEELDERTVFGQALVGAEQQQRAFFLHVLVVRRNLLLGLGKNLVDQAALCLDNLLDIVLVLVEVLLLALGHGT